MSWVATAIVVTTASSAAYQQRKSRKAAKKGRQEALEDAATARRSEVFAETEGQGIGQLGKIALELDDEIDPNITNARAGKSKVRL
jgi:hypothetical protein